MARTGVADDYASSLVLELTNHLFGCKTKPRFVNYSESSHRFKDSPPEARSVGPYFRLWSTNCYQLKGPVTSLPTFISGGT
jgi:hypothetical protein